jgi:hypothetical protein
MNKLFLTVLFPLLVFAGNLPDSIKTPGDTVSFIMLMDLCNKEFLSKQPISNKTGNAAFLNYRIYGADRYKYVLDLLIPVNLGGNAEIKNVWPQLKNTKWSSYRKDALEDTLNWMICNAKITLKEARFVIKKDWITAYRYYVWKDTTIIIEVK